MTKLDFASYANIKANNFSTLKYIDDSPLHYQHALKFGREDTTGLLKGRAAHTAVFEPDEFGRKYAVFKGKVRKGPKWEEFKAVHEGEDILKLDEYEQALAIRDAVRKHPVVKRFLERGNPEQTIEWTDARTGLKCKARLDWYSDEVLFDLKGTQSVNARRFGALAARMKYHVQVAMQSDGLMTAHGIRPPAKIVAVEIKPPYDVAVFPLSDDDLFVGAETYQGWLDRVVECQASGKWPGRYPEEEPLSLPTYVFADDNIEDGTFTVGGEA